MNNIVIIGGANIDYTGYIKNKENLYESNIGHVDICFGGVARNICENLANQGIKPSFIAALGDDILGKAIKEQLLSLGVNLYIPEGIEKTGSFLSINNNKGNLLLGICDTNYINKLSPEYLNSIKDVLDNADFIALDANITDESLNYLFDNYSDKYIIADGISSGKVVKLKPYLNKISLLKVNIFEGKTLTNKINKEDIIHALVEAGVKTVVMTSGSDDTIYNINNKLFYEKTIKVDNIINTTGAGDAFLAGVIHGLFNNEDISSCIKKGHLMAANNVLVLNTVNNKKIL